MSNEQNELQVTDKECLICGDLLHTKYSHHLKCNHGFHYECILKTFETNRDSTGIKNKYLNYCPYCSKEEGLLPIVNGLKTLKRGIHYTIDLNIKNIPSYLSEPCIATYVKGKKKGERCNKRCKLASEFCGIHKNYKKT